MKLLLLSSSRAGSSAFLEHAIPLIKACLNEQIKNILFIPYAGIHIGFDTYIDKVSSGLSGLNANISSIHQHSCPKKAIQEAEAIFVGGGNTFCLLNSLYQKQLIEIIQEKVRSGTPYIGWSAGSNIAAPTIRTTNDMPIIEPPSFNALNFVSFQINPHYIEGNPPGHNGETREQRISEFLTVNPKQKVVGIPEGTALQIDNEKIQYLGNIQGAVFTKERKIQIDSQSNLTELLR